jgi:hypothetical protein
MWSASSNLVSTVAGTGLTGLSKDGSPGNVTALFNPRGIVVLPTYDILVAEISIHRIRFISAGGGTVSTWAGSTDGSSGFSGDGGPATSALLFSPAFLTFEPNSGSVYFSDQGNYRIREVLANGTIQTVVGSGASGYLDALNPLSAVASGLSGHAFDAQGSLLFIDRHVFQCTC